jgi:hypothetical protein
LTGLGQKKTTMKQQKELSEGKCLCQKRLFFYLHAAYTSACTHSRHSPLICFLMVIMDGVDLFPYGHHGWGLSFHH